MKQHLSKFPVLFWSCLAVIGVLALISNYSLTVFREGVAGLNNWMFSSFGWFYMLFAFGALVSFITIGLSPLGSIRLGGQDAKPDFSWFSWCTMLFSAGMGSGLLFWGPAEPLYHFVNPPVTDATTTLDKAITALQFAFFHWGFHPWAIYGLTAMAVGFLGFNMNKGFNIGRVLFDKTSGKWSILGFGIEKMTFLSILFGVAASFGMSVLQIESGVHRLLGIDSFPGLKMLIIVVFTFSFLLSSSSGLSSGIKILSNLGMLGSIALMILVFAFGPKMGLMPEVLKATPEFFSNLPAWSFGLANFTSPDWIRDWTVKYWAWWIAWAPFVGIFVALTSKGRTIRELMVVSVLVPSIFSFLWFTVFGESAIALHLLQHGAETIQFGKTSMILFNLLGSISQLPWLPFLALFLISIFFINSADSAAYTMASLSMPKKHSKQKPYLVLQLGWGLLVSALTILLLYSGGIRLLQQVLLIPVLPFSVYLVVVFVHTLFKMKAYHREMDATAHPPCEKCPG